MSALRLPLFVFLLTAGGVHAQAPGEITFWESVRDSKNPAELQAYIDQYPNGSFVVLAKARLATLGQKSAAPAAQSPRAPAAVTSNPPPPRVTTATRMPQVGDTWTYRLTFPKRFGTPKSQERDRTQVVKIDTVAGGKIVEQLTSDGGTPSESTHSREVYLVPQDVSVLSPYLIAFRNLSTGSLGTIATNTQCSGDYRCTARGRVMGQEKITLAAGQFLATKVMVEESWQAISGASAGLQTGRMNGGRRLYVWYAPELKRAIKYSSRHLAGDSPPLETEFDLELVSYQVK